MEDLNAQVLQGFRIRPRRIIKEKSYYICNTDGGRRVIRKSMDTKGHIAFQHGLKERLRGLGFTNIDRYYNSADNMPFFEHENNIYVMTDFFDQRESDFSEPRDMRKIIRQVARFHSIAKEMSLEPVFYGNDNLLGTYRKQIREIEAIKKSIGKRRRLSDFDVIFLKNYDGYHRLMCEAVTILEKTRLQQAVAAARQQASICHNLLKEEHLLIEGDTVYMIGFSQAAVDYFVFDLCSLIQRYAKNMQEPAMGIYDILNLYDKYHTLCKEDTEVLLGLLKYPGKFVKICRQYYSKKRTWTPSAIISRLETIVDGKESYDSFVDSLLI